MGEPTREIFWNIQYPWIMYSLAAIAIAIFIWALVRIPRRWHVGGAPEFVSSRRERSRAFLRLALVDGLIHRKFFGADKKDWRFRELYAGVAHFLIFSGCIIFLLGAALDAISHYFFHFMQGNFYLGYSVVTDSFGILAIIGVLMAIVRRYIWKPERLDNRWDDLVTLLLILVVVVTGFIVEGLRIAATELQLHPSWAPWSPGGYVLAKAFSGASQSTLLTWHVGMWWFHVVLGLGAIRLRLAV